MTRFISFAFILAASITSFAQSSSVSGKITDKNHEPVAGASVHLLNTNILGISDAEGNFTLAIQNSGTYTLQVTAVGFASVERSLKSEAGTAPVTIELSENFTQLDDIVVTAQKQEELIQQIPASISSISARQVQEYRIWNTQDITAIVPNLYSANPGDGRNVTSIRGITSTSYDPSVATYVDGVNQFGLDTYIAQLFDVDRIEVLRGPQGTLYGRNAMGGVVNIITKQPTNTTNGFAEVSFGNYDQQRYTAAVRTPLIKDKLFFGVSAVYDHSGGFYTNDFTHSKFDNVKRLTGNYYLKFIASQNWAFTLNLKHNQNRNKGTFPLNNYDDAIANPFHLSQDAVTTMHDNVFNTSFSAVYSGAKFNFSSQSAYQSNYRFYKTPIDGDFSPLDVVTIINNYGRKWNNVKVLTQEFKLTSPAGSSSNLHWTAGTYLFYQNNPTKQATRYGSKASVYGLSDSLFSTISSTKSTSLGAAAFGQATYSFTERLSLTGGIRYDYEHKKQNVLGEYQHDPDPNPQFVTQPDTSGSVSFHAFSPKLTFGWLATDNNNLFVSYTRGFRTGGLTPLSSDPSQPPLHPFYPEYSNNFEASSKNTFLDNHLRANLTLFYINVTNAQIPRLVLPDAVTITSNAGRLTSKGVELELSATPLKGIQIDYNLGVNDARFKKKASNEEFSGKHQIFTPPVTSMLAVQYSSAVKRGSDLRLVLRGEWMYLGKKYFNYSDEPLTQGSYNLFNARIGGSAHGFEITFWGRNLNNKKYIDYAYDFGVFHLGNPRNFGVTLRKNF